jgi:hypothetical protein
MFASNKTEKHAPHTPAKKAMKKKEEKITKHQK